MATEKKSKRLYTLPIIVLAQFAGTSLWFASNAVLPFLTFGFPAEAVEHLTLVVQTGFICGTLIFAVFSVSDRYRANYVFFLSALAGSVFTFAASYSSEYMVWLALRFLTGFALAGIYPVGMKLAATYYKEGLGLALGFLVGALVLGTALPHALVAFQLNLSPLDVLRFVSLVAFAGGILIFILVPEGSFTGKPLRFSFSGLKKSFKNTGFRKAAFGYFGHMWELYAFWAFIPFYLLVYENYHLTDLNIPFLSFLIIAIGSVSCVLGGYLSKRFGSEKIAYVQLKASLMCCLLSPLMLTLNFHVFLLFVCFWGLTVVGDSPQFSSLTAHFASKGYVGSALTLVTSIGFAVTLFSIQLLSLVRMVGAYVWIMLPLALGPLVALIYRYKFTSE